MAHALEHEVLNDQQIDAALQTLSGWRRDGVKIRKQYAFGSFREAIAFVGRVADVAETFNHHPDIEIHFKNVDVVLWTHKKNATTKADVAVATEIENAV
jgi:4a-hydroxytetrahydrobiopterin dehydratase